MKKVKKILIGTHNQGKYKEISQLLPKEIKKVSPINLKIKSPKETGKSFLANSKLKANYFFRKSPSHYHMMLLVMHAYKYKEDLTVEELKTKLFKTSRPKSALMINEACEKGFFFLEKTSGDQRKKHIKPSVSFIEEFNKYIETLKHLSF